MFAIPDIRESLLAVYDSADPDEVKVAKISTVVEDHQAKQSSRKRYFFPEVGSLAHHRFADWIVCLPHLA